MGDLIDTFLRRLGVFAVSAFVLLSSAVVGGVLADRLMGGVGWWTPVGVILGSAIFFAYTVFCVAVGMDSPLDDILYEDRKGL